MLATMLDQLASALMTLEQPEQSVATSDCDGCAVATAGMPVMTPRESVRDV